jgi:membrane protein implicated in regulation of membrane protease activity
MPEWLFWFLLGIGLIAIEAVVAFTLYAGTVALAAFPAAIAAALGASMEVQVAIFAVGAGLSVLLVRPIAKAHLITPPKIATNAGALIGTIGMVTREVDDDSGEVKIKGGEVWSARTTSGEVYAEGTEVRIREVRGVTVMVEPAQPEERST